MIDAGLVAARTLHFAAAMTLFGLALFPFYTYPGRTIGEAARLSRWLVASLRLSALFALLSGLGWGLFTVSNMSGSLRSAVDPAAVWSIVSETGFGRVWVARLALGAVLLVRLTAHKKSPPSRDWVSVWLSAVVLLSLAGVGHTQADDGARGALHMAADGAHLLAAGAWLGGLVALGYLLALCHHAPTPEHTRDATTALLRFSGMGYVAVAVLVGSGLINMWFLVGSVMPVPETPYERLLLVKLCLFAGMCALAGLNRFWLIPSLVQQNSGQPGTHFARLRQHVLGEQVLGAVIIVIVGLLGTIQPGRV